MKNQVSKFEQFFVNSLTEDQQKKVKGGGISTETLTRIGG